MSMYDWKQFIWIYLLLVNFFTLVGFGWDKRLSQRRLNRIPERTLWWLIILGGSLGGWVGMHFFRHKTRHLQFRWGIPALLLAQVVVFIYCYYR